MTSHLSLHVDNDEKISVSVGHCKETGGSWISLKIGPRGEVCIFGTMDKLIEIRNHIACEVIPNGVP